MKKYLLPILLVLIMALIPIQNASADFGNYAGSSDYDYGGSSSDWGSSSSSGWGSSSSSGWGSSSSSDWDSSSSDSDFSSSLIAFMIAIPIVLIKKLINADKDQSTYDEHDTHTNASRTSKPIKTENYNSISSLKKKDPTFSEDAIIERIADWYVQMQNCWTERNLEPLRPYLTDDLYARTSRMLEDMRSAGEINCVENIEVLGVNLFGWKSDNVNVTLHARVRTRITDYVIDEHTKEIKRGDPNAELFMVYEWTLIRTKGVTTKKKSGTKKISCPNCSAPMNIAQSVQCPYCQTTVKRSEHDWVLSSIRGISQHTAV